MKEGISKDILRIMATRKEVKEDLKAQRRSAVTMFRNESANLRNSGYIDFQAMAHDMLKRYPDEIKKVQTNLYNRVMQAKRSDGFSQAVGSKAVGFDGKSAYCAFAYEKVTCDSLNCVQPIALQKHLKSQVHQLLSPSSRTSAENFRRLGEKYYQCSDDFDTLINNGKDGDLLVFQRDGKWLGHAIRINVDKNGKKTITSFNGDHLNISISEAKKLWGKNIALGGMQLAHVNDYIEDETVKYLHREYARNSQKFAKDFPMVKRYRKSLAEFIKYLPAADRKETMRSRLVQRPSTTYVAPKEPYISGYVRRQVSR